MIIFRNEIDKMDVLDSVIGSKDDLKLYSLDKKNDIVKLEAIGGSLAKFETQYEMINKDKPNNLKDIEQFFVLEINLNDKDYKNVKSYVLTKDKDKRIIHREDISEVNISLQEKTKIRNFINELIDELFIK